MKLDFIEFYELMVVNGGEQRFVEDIFSLNLRSPHTNIAEISKQKIWKRERTFIKQNKNKTKNKK